MQIGGPHCWGSIVGHITLHCACICCCCCTEYLVKTLEIKDEVDAAIPTFDKQLLEDKRQHPPSPQQVEVQVLQSGQIHFSTESTNSVRTSLETDHHSCRVTAGLSASSEHEQEHRTCSGTARLSASSQLPTRTSVCMLTPTHLPLSHPHHDQLKRPLDSRTNRSDGMTGACPAVGSEQETHALSVCSDVSTQTPHPSHTTLVHRAHLHNTAEALQIPIVREKNCTHLYNTAEALPIPIIREKNCTHLCNTADTPPTAAVRENEMCQPDTPSNPLVEMGTSELDKSQPRRSARITSQRGHVNDSRINVPCKRGKLSPFFAKRSRSNDFSQDFVGRRLDHHPLEWCSEDVSDFVDGICSNYRDTFKEHVSIYQCHNS